MAKKILLGITGGIAAYKTPDLIRLLKKQGIGVQAVMTKAAMQFVTPTTLLSVSGNRVLTPDWDLQDDPYDHLNITKNVSAVLIAPATADFIGKLAHGVADDLLLTTMLAVECPVYIAPSMNPAMYVNQAVQENLSTLEKRGINIIRPEKGEMACGDFGEGRLPSIETLAGIIAGAVGAKADLAGKRIVVTAGPTQEPIDAVRYISNRSSGKMGVAIAVAAQERGAEVTLIHGPLSVPVPDGVKAVPVRTAKEMQEAVNGRFENADMLVMAAAVSDFRPSAVYDSKIKKGKMERAIPLEQNPDILETAARAKGNRVVVGFAAETGEFLENAREKLMAKNMDMICVNDVGRGDIGFDSDFNEVTVISRGSEPLDLPRSDKLTIANRILDQALPLLRKRAALAV